MKCPHCNQEHPDGFQFCPATGRKLDQLKACTLNPQCPDHGKHILPLDSLFCPTCGCKLEDNTQDIDSEDEEVYDNEYDDTPCCPECGSDDVTDDGSDYLQYECNDCGHIWGNNNEEEEEDSDDYEDELHKFFPVAGITLGETTVEAAEEQDYLYDEFDYFSGHEHCDYYDEDGTTLIMYKGIQFRKEDEDSCITHIYMTRYDPMFEEWKDLGFDWEMSYNEWKKLFMELGYDIQVIKRPHKEYWEEQGYWYLDATFIADAPDYSIRFRLQFDYGRSGYSQSSKKTLYSIRVYSRNSSKWDE